MCIYYKGQTNLSYVDEDHIIPAGIGGRRTLPKGVVSTEFNRDFSKWEQEFIRDSFISIARTLEGPGKRGSLSPQKATKSKIHVMQHPTDFNRCGLGYYKLGKPFEIPCLQWDTLHGQVIFGLDFKDKEHTRKVIQQFKDQCSSPGNLRIRKIYDPRLPVGTVLFGIQDGIEERCNAFFAKNEQDPFDLSQEVIGKIGRSLQLTESMDMEQYRPHSRATILFKEDYLRIYGKVAFNCLAYFGGEAFALDACFDPVRDWIAYGGENQFVQLDTRTSGPFLCTGLPFPPAAHYVTITCLQKTLLAHISFYGGLRAIVHLGHLSQDIPAPFRNAGLICHWRNRQEFTLSEYIIQVSQGNQFTEDQLPKQPG